MSRYEQAKGTGSTTIVGSAKIPGFGTQPQKNYTLGEEINSWTDGEVYIYKILTDVLEDTKPKPDSSADTEGAGRT